MPPDLLHVLGYVTGGILYTMLLVMALRERTGDRLTVGAALAGLTWNVGELIVRGAHLLGWYQVEPWVAALSFAALGFLPALVIHSVARTAGDTAAHVPRLARWITRLAYLSAASAGATQLLAAGRIGQVPDPRGLILQTVSVAWLAPVLVVATRGQTNARRAIWMTGLAFFAVSALHVGTVHGPRESWAMKLLGHHASIPLAFAILYQDYRFALADLFLKQALNLILVVAVVFGLWSVVGPQLVTPSMPSGAIGLLLGAWVASSFLFPLVRRAATQFVDRVVLMRQDDQKLIEALTQRLQSAGTEEEALTSACETLQPAMSATRVTWELADAGTDDPPPASIVAVPTGEAPHYRLRIGRLAGGRRLLSGDVATLERAAATLARRLDTLRLTAERYDRALEEREIRALATEAELTALRAQINPHFLFNALTTIGYLVTNAPERAVDTLMRLTTLLRRVLRAEGEFTTLRREADLIACYLDIERERFEERLQTEIDIPPAIADLPIPTLLVQPLVENAVKHGVSASRSGGRISLRAHLEGDGMVHIAVRNTGAPLRGRSPGALGGVGLSNVERRLANHYDGAARFSLRSTPSGETIAEILMPVSVDGQASAPETPEVRATALGKTASSGRVRRTAATTRREG
jgi:signal transduction histidine kinase